MLGDGVEGDEELAHGGDEGELFGFALFDQGAIGEREAGRPAAEGEDSHVEGAPDLLAAAVDDPAAAHQAAVPGDRGQADQARDLAPVELAQLGQLGQERGDQDRAGAGRALEQGGLGLQLRVAGDRVLQQPVERDLVLAQPPQRGLGALDQGGRAQMGQLLAARADLGQELPPVSQGLGQRLAGTGPDRVGAGLANAP